MECLQQIVFPPLRIMSCIIKTTSIYQGFPLCLGDHEYIYALTNFVWGRKEFEIAHAEDVVKPCKDRFSDNLESYLVPKLII